MIKEEKIINDLDLTILLNHVLFLLLCTDQLGVVLLGDDKY